MTFYLCSRCKSHSETNYIVYKQWHCISVHPTSWEFLLPTKNQWGDIRANLGGSSDGNVYLDVESIDAIFVHVQPMVNIGENVGEMIFSTPQKSP
jgi:hypothetical protein